MRDIILACVGGIIALAGGVYLARLLYYKKFGVIAKAEVTDAAAVTKRAGVYRQAYSDCQACQPLYPYSAL